MQIPCSDKQIVCNFCRCVFDNSLATEAIVKFIANGDLFPCPTCHSLTTLPHNKDVSSPDAQAGFHEYIFGTDASRFNSYINDVASLRRLITNDYPIYFGDKTSELLCEVGAGRGSLLKALRDEGYSAIGCEYSQRLVSAGRAAYGLPDSVFFQINAWDLPAYLRDNSIKPSVLVMWHVIEHIQHSLELLESLVKVCADKIMLIFQTPLPVPEYVYPEHLFFPSTETYHFVAERLGLSVKLLYVIPYTRFVTCVMSNKGVPEGKIYPKQQGTPGFSVIGQLITQLDAGLQELDLVTKEQYATITQLESCLSPNQCGSDKPLTLANDLSQIANILQSAFLKKEKTIALSQQIQKLTNENQNLRLELLRAEAQLDLLKDVFLEIKGQK
jgi:hypothetical protein